MAEYAPSLRVTARGPSLGRHKGRDIPAWVEDAAGHRFAFDRTAEGDPDGTTPLAQLDRGEALLAPGPIYRSIA